MPENFDAADSAEYSFPASAPPEPLSNMTTEDPGDGLPGVPTEGTWTDDAPPPTAPDATAPKEGRRRLRRFFDGRNPPPIMKPKNFVTAAAYRPACVLMHGGGFTPSRSTSAAAYAEYWGETPAKYVCAASV